MSSTGVVIKPKETYRKSNLCHRINSLLNIAYRLIPVLLKNKYDLKDTFFLWRTVSGKFD